MVHIVRDTTLSYSHGLASLAGALQDAGHTALSLITVRDADAIASAVSITASEPRAVLFSCMSNQWDLACGIAAHIKRLHPEALLVVGGSHVEAAPDSLRCTAFDIAVRGEAENLIVELVEGRYRGKSMRVGECMLVHGTPVEDLDTLPMPRLSIFERADVLGYPSVMFSRGCPYGCSYCMSRRGGWAEKVRWKSPARAVREAEDLVAYADPAEVYIDDDTFLKNPRWVTEFCGLYKQRLTAPFFCNARPETVKGEVVALLADAGCEAIGIGIESGSARIREEVLLRRMSDEQIVRAFDAAHAAGLKTWSFNMVGIPGETIEDLEATIALNDRVATEYVRVSVFTPYPGTILQTPGQDIAYSRGYFRPSVSLTGELKSVYAEWLERLDREGRLWLTDAEGALLDLQS